jgi:glycosyltransferase involved in cell wall biosynthesis
VVHICHDYPYTPVYSSLVTALEKCERYEHLVYIPHAANSHPPRKYVLHRSEQIYSAAFSRFKRPLFRNKSAAIVRDMERNIVRGSSDIVHAHFLFASGYVAMSLKERHGTPYVVAVRNTDLGALRTRGPAWTRVAERVVAAADAVVFISPAYRNAYLALNISDKHRSEIQAKSIVVPNGVSEYWLHAEGTKRSALDPRAPRLLYVGEFTSNKNIEAVIRVLGVLRERGYQPSLQLVGAGDDWERIRAMAGRLDDSIAVRPQIDSKAELRDIYMQSDIFVMPSFTETFGLVYVEAMSQGVPVIYSEGQGIDGYFPDGQVGYSCNPQSVASIADCVEQIVNSYDRMSGDCVAASKQFDWNLIAARYDEVYGRLFELDAPV